MKKHNIYAITGLKALQRAAKKVAEDARKNNYKIPVWNNGRIEYRLPGISTEQGVSADERFSVKDVEGECEGEKVKTEKSLAKLLRDRCL